MGGQLGPSLKLLAPLQHYRIDRIEGFLILLKVPFKLVRLRLVVFFEHDNRKLIRVTALSYAVTALSQAVAALS